MAERAVYLPTQLQRRSAALDKTGAYCSQTGGCLQSVSDAVPGGNVVPGVYERKRHGYSLVHPDAERGVNNTYLILDWVNMNTFFQKAVPIWAKGRADEMNCELAFRAIIAGQDASLHLAASSIYRVWVNGKEVVTVWCSPWEADITSYVHEGKNNLKIEVVNSLMNRMIGDASLPESERFTYAYPQIATPTDKLVPSGIMEQLNLVYRQCQ